MAQNHLEKSLRIGSLLVNGASGSVLFVDADGKIYQDNSNFFWDAINKRLGIGTTSPNNKLDVRGSVALGAVGAVEWYNSSWSYRKPTTIDHT